MKNLKPIPEHLKKQGVRWVSVNITSPFICFKELSEKVHDKYLLVCSGDEDNFLEGEEFRFWSHDNIQEIDQPEEPKKIP